MKISPAFVIHILPDPFDPVPHVGGTAFDGFEAWLIFAVTTYSLTVGEVEVPTVSKATANRPYGPWSLPVPASK